jgi:methylmalonyl-CoA mutase
MREVDALGGMAKAIDAGIPKMRIEEAAAKTQGRIDSGAQKIIGVNAFRPENEPPVPVLKVDNAAVRAEQIAKLADLKRTRDQAAVEAALAALRHGAAANANLLDLSVKAARARATVGEISLAMETVFGRHDARPTVVRGVYKRETGADSLAVLRVEGLVQAFAENDGRAPKLVVAKMGQDGHDRGQKVIASAFSDLGFDVELGPLFATPEEAAAQAVAASAHVIGVSSLAAGHLTLVPQLRAALAGLGRGDIMIVVGGVIPPEDVQPLIDMGAAAVFLPGTNIPEAAEKLLAELNARLGYAQRPAAE